MVDTEENNLQNIDEEIKKFREMPEDIKAYVNENLNK